MSIQLTIGRESNSYRQGVVLGLTMAETMLLLVFCLLLAAAAVFAREREKLDKSEALVQSLRNQNEWLMASLKKEIPDDWQHLVVGLQQKGVTPAAVQKSFDAMMQIDEAARAEGQAADPAHYPGLVREGIRAQATAALPQSEGGHKWPPMIRLSEADGYNFDTLSAALSPAFEAKLSGTVTATIRAYIDEYKVNVIEVVGHTDEASIKERASNLDKELIPVLRDRGAADKLAPADNAGLGLARAVAVANVLRKQEGLKGNTILPYSAAQLVALGDVLSDGSSPGDDKTRRRIEIRLRRADSPPLSGGGSSVAVKQAHAAPQAAAQPARSIAGRASIIDADTIEIHGERIRLWGIDAVEGRQTCRLGGQQWRCAQDAAFAISAHLEGQSVQCTERGRDQYNRTVAVCTVRGGDLGGWLVSAGFALDYRRYSGGRYAAEQAAARAGKRGLWRGEFEPPWEWRRKQGR